MSERKTEQSNSRVMIAGTGSGCGKTTIVCGLLSALRNRGEQPAAFKCGPDYIDPMYHREVLGIDSRNLDSFFQPGEMLRENLIRGSLGKTIALIEGVMGYYDGLGSGSRYSCAEVAELTKTPVILVVDCSGRAVSAIAELQGFLHYRPEGARIRGVIFNRLPSKLYPQLAALAEAEGLRPCGYLPKNAVKKWESRHLGLITPAELPAFREEAELLAERIAETVDMDAVCRIAKEAEGLSGITDAGSGQTPGPEKDAPVVALARDEAFCFYYTENIEYLESRGIKIVPFSPIRDRELPDCDGLILPGGYPENHAKELEENEALRTRIRESIASGLPTIAECGGYLYLHRRLIDANKHEYAMSGIFDEDCSYEGMQKTFGYVKVSTDRDSLLGVAGAENRAHEFHYFRSGTAEKREATAFSCEKPDGSSRWSGGIVTDRLYAGFAHLFLPGSPAGERFTELVREHAARRRAERE